MRLKVLRDTTGDQGTFSVGVLEGSTWQFLELPWRNNANGVSCIPAGIYHARMVQSPHFGRAVYLLEYVPNREAIEMHPANWAGSIADGWHSDLRGCCAPGESRTTLTPPNGKPQAAIAESAKALSELIVVTKGEPIEIEFAWADGVSPE